MKKLIGVIIAVFIIAAVLSLLMSLGIGLGFGKGTGKGSGNSQISVTDDNGKPVEMKETELSTTGPTEDVDSEVIISIAISVVENSYFYQNKKITLDDLLIELESIEQEYVVEITDDNASLKAYNKLIDMLSEKSIDYTEVSSMG